MTTTDLPVAAPSDRTADPVTDPVTDPADGATSGAPSDGPAHPTAPLPAGAVRRAPASTRPGPVPPGVDARWVGVAHKVAARLAVDALERDRAGAEPLAEAALLREAGLPALLHPASAGGGGATWATALRVVREVAAGDGSIGQLLGYSYVNSANLVWVAGEEARRRWTALSARGQWLWGDAVNPVDPDLRLTPDPQVAGGYRLDGTKSFSTGGSTGDALVVTGLTTDTGHLLLVVVTGDQDGVVPGGDWDNLGQRLSASGSLTFTDVAVPPGAVLGALDEADAQGTLITPVIQAVFASLYLGITRGALATAAQYTRTTTRPWVVSEVTDARQDPYILATYGRLVARLSAAEALADAVGTHLDTVVEAGADLTWEARGELAEQVAALKVVSSDLAVEATSAVFEVTGARATSNRVGLDRFWRNARTHTLHDPVQHKAREVGDHFLNGTHPGFTLYT